MILASARIVRLPLAQTFLRPLSLSSHYGSRTTADRLIASLKSRNQHPRHFAATPHGSSKQLPPRPVVLDSDIEESFVKGTGPGGQKINKTNSAVQLKHLASGFVVKCQETRSRSQNRKIARRILAEKLEEAELGDNSRKNIKAREESKKKASKRKKSLRKYRALDSAKDPANDESEPLKDGKHEPEPIATDEQHESKTPSTGERS